MQLGRCVSAVCALCTLFLVSLAMCIPAMASTLAAVSQQSTSEPQSTQQKTSVEAKKNSASDLKTPSLPPGVNGAGVPLYKTIQEDWSSLAIGVSKLEPETPIVGQTDEGDGFTRHLIQL